MPSQTRKVCLSLLVLVVLFLGIDSAVGYLGDRGLERIPDTYTELSRVNYAVGKAAPDLLIVGSSRASHHYDTRMLGDSLRCEVYNAGLDGHGLTYASCLILNVADRCSPRLVVWEVSYKEDGSWNRKVNTLKPWFYRYENVNDAIRRINPPDEAWKCRLASYRFNSLFPRFINACIAGKDTLSGYLPLQDNGKGKRSAHRRDTVRVDGIDSCSRAIFTRTAAILQRKGIPLIVAISPDLRIYEGAASLEATCQSMNIPFFDAHALPQITDRPELFNDPSHMNSRGAELYTQCFLRFLRNRFGQWDKPEPDTTASSSKP